MAFTGYFFDYFGARLGRMKCSDYGKESVFLIKLMNTKEKGVLSLQKNDFQNVFEFQPGNLRMKIIYNSIFVSVEEEP